MIAIKGLKPEIYKNMHDVGLRFKEVYLNVDNLYDVWLINNLVTASPRSCVFIIYDVDNVFRLERSDFIEITIK